MKVYNNDEIPKDEFEKHGIIMTSETTCYFQLASSLPMEQYMKVINLIKGIGANTASLLAMPTMDDFKQDEFDRIKKSLLAHVQDVITLSEAAIEERNKRNS